MSEVDLILLGNFTLIIVLRDFNQKPYTSGVEVNGKVINVGSCIRVVVDLKFYKNATDNDCAKCSNLSFYIPTSLICFSHVSTASLTLVRVSS